MKFKPLLLSALVMTGAGLSWIYLEPRQRPVPLQSVHGVEAQANDETGPDTNAGEHASDYIAGVPEKILLPDKEAPSVNSQIETWEKHILRYAEQREKAVAAKEKVHELANRTVTLLSMLKEARERQARDLEPYTPLSGFNTMTLIMTIEKDFKEHLGFTFSEFLASQEPEELKKIL